MLDIYGLTALAYFAAAVAATFGVSQGSPRQTQVATGLLALGALLHGGTFYALHLREPKPSLGDPMVVPSLISWVAVLFFCAFLSRGRRAGLAVLIAPMAFLSVALLAGRLPGIAADPDAPHAAWSHLHVLLSAAGMALLGVAGGAGLIYILRHRRLKQKRPVAGSVLPSLESLDRINVVCLAIGFLLLTLGVVTGFFWTSARSGSFFPRDLHAAATLAAWGIYLVLVVGRFGVGQGPRPAALGAISGFGLLVLAWAGAGVLS
jgi:ABC-type uncharacterized transport system permease subunit